MPNVPNGFEDDAAAEAAEAFLTDTERVGYIAVQARYTDNEFRFPLTEAVRLDMAFASGDRYFEGPNIYGGRIRVRLDLVVASVVWTRAAFVARYIERDAEDARSRKPFE